MVEKRNRRRVFLGALLGAVSLLCIEAQAQVYSDADTVRSVQEKLNEAGFDCGTADGIAGSRTAEAITAWQNENQLTPSGEIDDELLASMGLSAAGTEETGSDTESMEALETAALSEAPEAQENETEAPSDPIEDVTIEGTVIYNAHQVAVTAALSEDGQAVEYRVQNASENPVVVMLGDLVANEVTLNIGEKTPDDYFFKLAIVLPLASGGKLDPYMRDLYVEAGGSGDMTMEIDSELRDIFSYEKVSQLATSVGVIGLPKELLLDGTDVLEGNIFVDVGSLTEVEIPDAAWDGVWTEVEGNVLYEDDQVRLIDLGLERVNSGSCYFGMVLENHSESRIGLSDVYDSAAVLNGETVEYPFCYGNALPGTRGYGYLSLEMEGIEEESDVTDAYCLLEISNDSYETMAEVEYTFGSEEDQNAAKEKSVEATAETEEAEERAGEQELFDFTVDEQTIYDCDGFVIKATGDDLNQYQDDSLMLCLEITNSTDVDATIFFSSVDGQVLGEDSYTYINGYQVSGNAYIDVAAGETVTNAVFLDTCALEAAGIENIGEIEVQFSICDENIDALAEMKPSVIRTSAYEEMDTELGEDMQTLYSDNGFTLRAKYIEADADTPASIVCAIRNDSGQAAGLHIDDMKINGIEDEDFYHWNYELAGRTFLRSYTVSQDFLDANGIDSIESLSICLGVSGPQRGDLTPIFEVSDIAIPLG